MTSLDITRMAREARLPACHATHPAALERFAALVAVAEREACATFLERGVDLAGLAGEPVMQRYTVELLLTLAAGIRSRGQA